MPAEFPTKDMELTHLIVVSDIEKSEYFYTNVLGAELHRRYGGSSVVLKLLSNWILLVTEGEPTKDKPTVSMKPLADADTVHGEMIFRVPDCRAAYETLVERGAKFLTPPVDWGEETRAFFRDPDGNLFEISAVTSK